MLLVLQPIVLTALQLLVALNFGVALLLVNVLKFWFVVPMVCSILLYLHLKTPCIMELVVSRLKSLPQ